MRKKAVSYTRVSSKEQAQEGYSPQAQKRLLYIFARENGFDIVKEFEEVETAKQKGRTAFNAMIDYVKTNGIKYILVEKTDRLYRNFRDYVTVEDLIDECEMTIYLVKENESIGKNATANQKFMHGIRTLMAKNFIDNLREESQKGISEKLQLGLFPGKPVIGYINQRDPITKKSNIAVDENNRLLIKTMFELYSTGRFSLNSLIDQLNRLALTQHLSPGRTLNKTTVAKLLVSPFYIGHFIWKGKRYTGKHEPIVDLDTWQKVQAVLKQRDRNTQKRYNVTPFSFKGLLRCGECQRSITAELKKKKHVYYRCTKYDRNCHQKPVNETILNQHVMQLLGNIKLSDKGSEYVVAALKQSLGEKRATHDVVYQNLMRERSRLKARLDRMYEDRLDGKITEEFYDAKFNEYTARLEQVELDMKQHDQADVNYYDFGVKILELAKNAQKLYEAANPEERQELLQYLLSNSTLKDRVPNFSLKKPFSLMAKHAQAKSRLTVRA